jgi:hypothetical protein
MRTKSQLRDTALRLRVRELLKDGRLPLMVSERIAGGYGSGHVCVACDQPITSIQIEYELDEYRDGKRLCFHLTCYLVWQGECAMTTRRSVKSDC